MPSDLDERTLSQHTDKYIPVHTDGTPITWEDDNDAHILGILHEVGRYYKRTGLFQTFFRHHAAVLPNGMLAVDSLSAVFFTSNKINDPRDFDNPAPPSAQRAAKYESLRTVPGSPFHGGPALPTLKAMPKELHKSVIVAEHSVETEDGKLLNSLINVFGHSVSSDELIDDADGSGYELLAALRARAASADIRDKGLVAAKYAKVIREGVIGETTHISFKAFIKSYKQAQRNVPPAARQPDEADADMIAIIAMRDPATRDLYELKATATPPTNLDEASKILSGILRGRMRCEEIDEVTSGAPSAAGLVAKAKAPKPAAGSSSTPSDPIKALAAALGADASKVAALLSSVADPNKDGTKAGGKERLDIPRDADGKPNKWIEGMALCRCGIKGGKHLFRECPKELEKKAKAAKKKAAALAEAAGAGGQADMVAALSALLGSLVVPPTVVVEGDPAGCGEGSGESSSGSGTRTNASSA